MPCRATQDGGVIVESSDKTWSSGEGNGNPLQYSCREIPMDKGAWQAIVHGVAKSQTQLRQLSTVELYVSLFCIIQVSYKCYHTFIFKKENNEKKFKKKNPIIGVYVK